MNNWEQLDPAGLVRLDDLVQGQYYCCFIKGETVIQMEVLKFKFDGRLKKFAFLSKTGYPALLGNIAESPSGTPLIFTDAKDAAYYGISLLYAFAGLEDGNG